MDTRGSFDPTTGEIKLRHDATLYTKFHEIAHKAQHTEKPFMFVLCCSLRLLPLANYLATLWIEYDALRRARKIMQFLGVWNSAVEREAKRAFRSYVFRKAIS